MSKEWSIRLNTTELKKTIRELKAYQRELDDKTQQLCKALAERGWEIANGNFISAVYNGEQGGHDVVVTIRPVNNGWIVEASGNDVCFIEFGAGVHFNLGSEYPGEKPEGVVGIGEYGSGLGGFDSWFYKGELGLPELTYGTPMQMPMLNTSQKLRQDLIEVAKEVFR